MKEINYVHNKTIDKLQCYWKESYCNIFCLKSAKAEVLSESGREFHNLAAKYEKECRPKVVVFGSGRDRI